MKTKSLFWGSLFIVAGALLLLDNLGILYVNVWKLIWPTFIIAAGIWTLMVASKGTSTEALEVEHVSVPLEGITQGKMTLSFGAGQVRVKGDADEGQLYNGSFGGGVEYKSKKDGDFTKITLMPDPTDFVQTMMPWMWGAREWSVNLSEEVVWQLHFEMGASDTRVDLTDLKVTDLEVDTGASNTKIILPANAGQTHVDLSGGAASILFEIPEGVAARIQVDSGLAAINIDRERFPRVGNFYKSENYETAANKVDINADFGAGSLSIR
ncbi:MAG: hypothetical protein HN392_09580 [Anaerolineae bacterium]|jgi:hypothetical protein|nr:hypothetical protein [Anaerolineae bacterium]MBT7074551.1 hypothetical protein [Anaerolineae bacterium]MBT7782710.1 hypothetical protein [Anaerolineae bacterium]